MNPSPEYPRDQYICDKLQALEGDVSKIKASETQLKVLFQLVVCSNSLTIQEAAFSLLYTVYSPIPRLSVTNPDSPGAYARPLKRVKYSFNSPNNSSNSPSATPTPAVWKPRFSAFVKAFEAYGADVSRLTQRSVRSTHTSSSSSSSSSSGHAEQSEQTEQTRKRKTLDVLAKDLDMDLARNSTAYEPKCTANLVLVLRLLNVLLQHHPASFSTTEREGLFGLYLRMSVDPVLLGLQAHSVLGRMAALLITSINPNTPADHLVTRVFSGY